ncbi:MAG: TRAP transporter small permease [Sagittula sp.]|jgi:TRAP-type C4-dicarboxylate transport system permease small subunit|uniref:TRAP transporter small permease n=1 Tax=unclassified Sagittula TaxID=2624628 RepID=UPI000C2D0B97|nr:MULTISPECIES: TRAP transporter small permease [unclassified Sagittula]AUC54928.1 TRAP transporter permease DctQ [Sagittula sp. P11]WHZ33698.1 TRAP transporter small permease [Sagittula sp. MA-2]
MQETVLKLSAVVARATKVFLWLAGAGLVGMTALIGWQVWGRFVLNDTPTWTETTSILLMGWFIFLGAAVGVREGNHLSFDVLLYILPERVQRFFHTVSDLVVIAFGGGMVWYGWQLAETTWATTIPNLGITGATSFLSLIVGGILMILLSLERLLRRSVGLATSRFGDDAIEE